MNPTRQTVLMAGTYNPEGVLTVEAIPELLASGAPIPLGKIKLDLSSFTANGLNRLNKELEAISSAIKKFKPRGVPDFLQFSLSNMLYPEVERPVTLACYQADELKRQSEKFLANAIGDLNEWILRCLPYVEKSSPGCLDLVVRYADERLRFIVEVKNRYNTMNAGSANRVYETMSACILDRHSAFYGAEAAVLVIRVPKAPMDFRPFCPSDGNSDSVRTQEKRILQVDMLHLLAKLTGDPFAYAKVMVYVLFVLMNLGVLSPEYDVSEYLSLLAFPD